MTRHRKVEVGTWHDRRFRELSAPPPNGQTLWLYLLTGPRTTVFPGLITATLEVIASDLRWPMDGKASLESAWYELADRGMAEADWRAGVVLLPKALMVAPGVPRETSGPGSTNAFRGWAKAWGDIPECDLKDRYLTELGDFASALDHAVALTGKTSKKTYHAEYLDSFSTSLRRVGDASRTSLEGVGDSRARARIPVPVPVPVLLGGDPDLGSLSSGPLQEPPGDRVQEPPETPVAAAAVNPSRVLAQCASAFVARINAAREAIAAERREQRPRLIGIMDDGGRAEGALRDRLRGVADPEADLDHVLTVAIAEARAPGGELRWLGWSIAEPKAWRAKLMTSPAEASRQRRGAPPRSALDYVDSAVEDLIASGFKVGDS